MTDVQCKANSKQNGRQCRKDAVPGYEVCHIHGGKTPRGFALPQTKTGRWSSSFPERLAPRYQESLDDVRLLELRDDIALLDARLADVLQRVDSGESGALWMRLLDAKTTYQTARDKDRAHFLAVLLSLIDEGATDFQAWEEVRAILTQRKQLVESERKREIELQQTLKVEQALMLLGAAGQGLRESVLRHCQDNPGLAQRILTDAQATISRLVRRDPVELPVAND